MEVHLKNLLVEKELTRANEIHGETFPSVEHAMSVFREEVEEVEEQTQEIRKNYDLFWKSYREGFVLEEFMETMETHAERLIDEVIQVLAMCEKYRKSDLVQTGSMQEFWKNKNKIGFKEEGK